MTRLLDGFRAWERSARLALLLALALLVVVSMVLSFGPESIRLPAVTGIAGLLIVIQIVVLWANRGMVTPYTKAQRRYLDGDFDAAVALLDPLRREGEAGARDLTLLGNTYRQMGRLIESEQVLLEAVDKAPKDYFPIYGFGRTLLSDGRYGEAADAIQRALALGAPESVRADLGEAFYRRGDVEQAQETLRSVDATGDVARALMVGYLLYQLKSAPPPGRAVIEAGLPYWQASAQRFQHTDYGQALAEDVRRLQTLVKES